MTRSIIKKLKFRARGALVQIGRIPIQTQVYVSLRDSFNGRWQAGEHLLIQNNIPFSRYFNNAYYVAKNFKIKINKSKKISYFDQMGTLKSTCETYTLNYKFHKQEIVN